MNLIEKIKEPILHELEEFNKVYHEVLVTDNELLLNVHEYIMSASGKQLRPILTILAAKYFGKVNQATLYSALSIELLHTASLVHDDVIDDTTERRGRPSVNARWTNKVAVLTGDYILSRSLYSANKTKHLDIMESISQVGMMLSDGELLQLVTRKQSAISEKDYFEIVERKTAFLFATCLEVGAISVGAKEEDIELMKNFGRNLGILFQIKDDIFDYYEDINIGKPTGNDVRDGKLTLPLIYALRNSEGEKREEIIKLIDSKKFSDENIQEIMQFARDNGGIDYATSMMDKIKSESLEQLNACTQNKNIKDALIRYLEFVTERHF